MIKRNTADLLIKHLIQQTYIDDLTFTSADLYR